MKTYLPTTYGPSRTIPGQSLKPSDLMRRHLAGTLPDINLEDYYEYHYDENGQMVKEPLPTLEMHELHKLAVAIREREYEEALKKRERDAEAFKHQIIKEHMDKLKAASQPETGETA